MILLNDIHISCNRKAGTTPESASALKLYTLKNLESFLATVDEDVLIAGDLYDSYQANLADVLATYKIFKGWLRKGFHLYVMAANHDIATDSSKVSSLEFMMALLEGNNTTYITGGQYINENTYVLAHQTNQAIFDKMLSEVPACRCLVLHCNYNSPFAKNADHSLDLSETAAKTLMHELIYIAHEHHSRTALGGKIFVGGCQWPTSVADCLGGKDKFAYRLEGNKLTPIKTWDSKQYVEMSWQNLVPSTAKFIRVTGSCKPEEAVEMTSAISKYRSISNAFVVASAVEIESQSDELNLKSLEDIQKFSIMDTLKEFLTTSEFDKVAAL